MIKFANAPCSWGVIEGYGFGGFNYTTLLNQMEEAGYNGTEMGNWGFMPTDPKKLRAELSARNMTLAGSWVVTDMQELAEQSDLTNQALKVANLLAEAGDDAVAVFGADHVRYPVRHNNAGSITPAESFTPAKWRIYADGINTLADTIKRETGVRSALHPHCSTWIESPEEIATAMNLLERDLVGLCIDTGHLTFGGSDLLKAFDLYGDRVIHVHLKDCDSKVAQRARTERLRYDQSVAANIFCNLGNGDVDFNAVLKNLHKRDYSGWAVIEQDIGQGGMDNPHQNAIDNLRYIKQLYENARS